MQPRPDRLAASHRTQAHRERVGCLRTSESCDRRPGPLAGEVRVEEEKRARARAGSPRPAPRWPPADRAVRPVAHEIRRVIHRRDPAIARHRRRSSRPRPRSGRPTRMRPADRGSGRGVPTPDRVVEARADDAAVVHEVRHVDRAPERRPGRGAAGGRIRIGADHAGAGSRAPGNRASTTRSRRGPASPRFRPAPDAACQRNEIHLRLDARDVECGGEIAGKSRLAQ